tara:strand:+ start:141 stop:356 length:216 start_codon:yes stop_codon:yes gene_type:complete
MNWVIPETAHPSFIFRFSGRCNEPCLEYGNLINDREIQTYDRVYDAVKNLGHDKLTETINRNACTHVFRIG